SVVLNDQILDDVVVAVVAVDGDDELIEFDVVVVDDED
uniref:Uncharacterized protein n=1 Tax=Panagrolaimus sp. ES5 TaxID=591445 RepID=A0AC34FQT4_9BILA